MKVAIIGAGIMAKNMAIRAKELNIATLCFAWAKGAVADKYVDYFYEPDPNAKSNVSVMYYNEAGTSQVRVSDELSYKVEDIVSLDPKPVTQYTYVRAQVADTTHDYTNHLFALGELHTADERYTNDQVNAAGNKESQIYGT